ncbi:unnamed protein product [Lactuca virosa]|uniref:Uncharacterized protein n=1 Tax=Lactuca virosa TaxID=75947 RepID=A0AAU9LHX8_9ASTR|nr:unnamed protein product [Lactuca virosa]
MVSSIRNLREVQAKHDVKTMKQRWNNIILWNNIIPKIRLGLTANQPKLNEADVMPLTNQVIIPDDDVPIEQPNNLKIPLHVIKTIGKNDLQLLTLHPNLGKPGKTNLQDDGSETFLIS